MPSSRGDTFSHKTSLEPWKDNLAYEASGAKIQWRLEGTTANNLKTEMVIQGLLLQHGFDEQHPNSPRENGLKSLLGREEARSQQLRSSVGVRKFDSV